MCSDEILRHDTKKDQETKKTEQKYQLPHSVRRTDFSIRALIINCLPEGKNNNPLKMKPILEY